MGIHCLIVIDAILLLVITKRCPGFHEDLLCGLCMMIECHGASMSIVQN